MRKKYINTNTCKIIYDLAVDNK